MSIAIKKSSAFSNVLPWVLCGLGALFYCYEYLLRISPSVMAPQLMARFSLNAGGFGFLMAFYYYIYSPMQLPVGVLMDRYGPRRLLIFACLICATSTLCFAMTHTTTVLAMMRFLMGLGSAFAFVGVLKLASIWLPENRFALISGLVTTLGMIGALLGDNAMAALVMQKGWRETLIYAAYVGFGLSALLFLFMRDGPYVGAKSMPFPTTTFKKLLPEVFTCIKNGWIWLNGLIGFLLYLPTSVFAELWGIPYLQNAYGFSREAAASAISMIFLGWAIGGPIAGWISDRLQRRCLPIIVGSLIASLLGAALIYLPHLNKIAVFVLLLGFGIFSSVEIIIFAIGRELSPPEVAGTAVAFTNMLTMIGGVIFQPLIGALLDLHWNGLKINHVPVYTIADYRSALAVIPAGLLLTVILAILMKETHPSKRRSTSSLSNTINH